MSTLLIAFGAFFGYFIAYHTYGRWLARKVFSIDPQAHVPSQDLKDGVDYVPTKKIVLFGHHFTSIAGTGPIVGPAIAIFWGWLPALLWVLFGAIFVGAVHDFGSLVVSLRNRGQSVGEIAGRLLNPRVRLVFFFILIFTLVIVVGIFGLVIAAIFTMYPETVMTVWFQLPLAIGIGYWVYKKNGGLLIPSVIVLSIMYGLIYVGAYRFPIALKPIAALGSLGTPVVIWTVLLLIYCYFASVLPVWMLLQPRDFINSMQLALALVFLVGGVLVTGLSGRADLAAVAPAINLTIPADAPPVWPFLFITIACGACSGFHSMVSSGTSSKQLACEPHAQFVGYGAMLMEGVLAVLVIVACTAGVAMGKFDRQIDLEHPAGYAYVAHLEEGTGDQLTGGAAWRARYPTDGKWADFTLAQQVRSFVEGGANLLSSIKIPLKMGIGIMAVLLACFAATTLDTATRLARYVVQELGAELKIPALSNRYFATMLVVLVSGALAMYPGPNGPGSGGLILWPLFGATNQLLAGLAFLVIAFFLWRRGRPVWMVVIPGMFMLLIPGWGMLHAILLMWAPWLEGGGKPVLFVMGSLIVFLQIWMLTEAVILWPRVRGRLEDILPPIAPRTGPEAEGGRAC